MKNLNNTCTLVSIINGRESAKTFTSKDKAIKTISKELLANNLEVSEVIERADREEYYCSDRSRFILFTA